MKRIFKVLIAWMAFLTGLGVCEAEGNFGVL